MQVFKPPRLLQLGCLLVAQSLFWISSVAHGNALKVNNANSTIQFTFKQMEVPVKGVFKRFNAVIDYDQLKPENSKARIDIDLKSIDLPAPEYNAEVLKKEWFNATQYPQASFIATSMKAMGVGKLFVSGTLTMKGKSILVSFPLSIKSEANTQTFEGNFTIKRLSFNIGEAEWKDTSMLADEITIQFRIAGTQ